MTGSQPSRRDFLRRLAAAPAAAALAPLLPTATAEPAAVEPLIAAVCPDVSCPVIEIASLPWNRMAVIDRWGNLVWRAGDGPCPLQLFQGDDPAGSEKSLPPADPPG